MAPLVRVAANLRAVLAAHVAFQLMDWRGLPTAHNVELNGLVGVTAKAPDFEIAVSRIECVA